ncbi:coagulation factor 5/8 type domain-containing protein [bacterium CG_4_9_14_3_um_filter_65_15]|nr:MAG: coagulation factor 5/8 type domain-containing protein [bacterium CG_4_9_14_3_um_filter_65_15]
MRAALPGLVSVLLACCGMLTGCGPQSPVSLQDPAVWTAHPADGVTMKLADEQGSLRLDFSFAGGGWAIARRTVDLDLPANYAFRFRLRGAGTANHLEFKLSDRSGENVWWHVERDVRWPDQWREISIPRRRIEFAWGPQGGGEIRHVAAIEFAVTAGGGGTGTVWIDGLELVPLDEVTGPPPPLVAQAGSQEKDHPDSAAVDGDSLTWWAPAPADTAPQLEIDTGRAREFSGLEVAWVPGRSAADCWVMVSLDGKTWQEPTQVRGRIGDREVFSLPETQARFVRLRMSRRPGDDGPALADLTLHPVDWATSPTEFFMRLACRSRPGIYPRGFLGRPTAWTVVGVDADDREGLLGADGAVEAGPQGFSIEPFLAVGGRLVTWHDVESVPSLIDGNLPVPQVAWEAGPWRLVVTALGIGEPGRSSVLARYRLENRGADPAEADLCLALRPFQVNPPSQTLNNPGGVARIETLERRGDLVLVDGKPGALFLRTPDAFGATTSAHGDVVEAYLDHGLLPTADTAQDPFAAASGAARFTLRVQPGAVEQVDVLLPLHDESPLPEGLDADAAQHQAVASWRKVRDTVVITGPPQAREFLDTLDAQVGWILVNRAGVGFQPGARSYARSWIRDGALTGDTLLRLGHAGEVRDFLTWFAPFQYPDGKVPCVVDRRGPDPVPEHDSTGEFIHLVVQYYRYTGDRELLREMWPRILAGVDYLEALLDTRRTDAYRQADKREFFGILPPSISHEGYAAKPMHSYWDDFWALRGLRDAVWVADGAGAGVATESQRLRLIAARDEFAADLQASIPAAMARHDIAHIPGCADLGDFDPTSTTIALDPAAGENLLPAGAIEATFAGYWDFFTARRDGAPWDAFTPYEVRTIGSAVRLGWRERVAELTDFFLAHRTPPGWRQWAEVVASDSLHARFIGDMPHTWVGSDFVRSGLDMFAYELRREELGGPALVLAAGLPAAWLREGGVEVEGLATPYGALSYRLYRGDDQVVMSIGEGLDLPAGGLLCDPPAEGRQPTVGGTRPELDDQGRVRIRALPVIVTWSR